jgi:predicted RNA-binding Zn-ribbon protein involved in translation (DUF1610 family)
MSNLEEMNIFQAVVLAGIGNVEEPHAMLCFSHGGSCRSVLYNAWHGFSCPKCGEEIPETSTRQEGGEYNVFE